MPKNHSGDMIETNLYRRLSFGPLSLGSSLDGAEETSLIFVGYPGETPSGLHDLGNLFSSPSFSMKYGELSSCLVLSLGQKIQSRTTVPDPHLLPCRHQTLDLILISDSRSCFTNILVDGKTSDHEPIIIMGAGTGNQTTHPPLAIPTTPQRSCLRDRPSSALLRPRPMHSYAIFKSFWACPDTTIGPSYMAHLSACSSNEKYIIFGLGQLGLGPCRR
ncbi:unnamed protein product [Arabis nemorensis]|uniref:Uncharacterized protein n=1 Tax=Arabis nemorensis TaxID=586526 RepID=A0A565CFF6_9BRAS|nr:unnamed protein product [Arabis nemorensis]